MPPARKCLTGPATAPFFRFEEFHERLPQHRRTHLAERLPPPDPERPTTRLPARRTRRLHRRARRGIRLPGVVRQRTGAAPGSAARRIRRTTVRPRLQPPGATLVDARRQPGRRPGRRPQRLLVRTRSGPGPGRHGPRHAADVRPALPASAELRAGPERGPQPVPERTRHRRGLADPALHPGADRLRAALQQPDALSLPAPLPVAAGQSPWHPRPGAERAYGLLRPGPGPGAAGLRRIRRHHPRRSRATDPPYRALRLAPAHGRADRGTDHVPRRADRQHRDLHRRRLEAVAGTPSEGPAGARRASAAGRHRHPERPAQALPPRRQPVQAPALPARDQAEDDHDHPGGLRTGRHPRRRTGLAAIRRRPALPAGAQRGRLPGRHRQPEPT
ncbi:hypothetical protein PA6761_03574 [Pseudomonas aeruginosa]